MKNSKKDGLQMLSERPGFLLRRANQIAISLFLDAIGDLQVTTTQFGALTALSTGTPMDQAALARMLRLDRSTTGLVVVNLERRGAISRSEDPSDARRKVLSITETGKSLLEQVVAASEHVPTIELSVFSPREAQEFILLLRKFVSAFDPEVSLRASARGGEVSHGVTRRSTNQ